MGEYIYLVITDQIDGWAARIVKAFFRVLSYPYRFAVQNLVRAYRKGWLKTVALPHPVISVGNLTWGGVGKTPLIRLIAEHCRVEGKKPIILMRGYMHHSSPRHDQSETSDEAALLADQLHSVPIVMGKDRVDGARKIAQEQPVDVYLLDDGYQQWKINKDLNILVIDSLDPFGNGYCLPRGILREPMAAINRADVIVLSRSDVGCDALKDITDVVQTYNPGAQIVYARHRPVRFKDLQNSQIYDLEYLKGRRAAYFCGIGNPVSFHRMLIDLGADISTRWVYMDHHQYTQSDLSHIAYQSRIEGNSLLVTTSKDAVKLMPYLSTWSKDIQLLVLEIEMEITKNHHEFNQRIDSVLFR